MIMVGNLRKFAKYTSVFLLVGGSFAMAACENDSNDTGEINLFGYERCEEEGKLVTLSGTAETFTKGGFKGGKVDTSKNFYPTESFTSMFGELNAKFDINTVLSSDYFTKFEVGIGAAAAGLAWDTTLSDKSSGGTGLNNNYIGAWSGYLGGDSNAGNRQVIVHNAYVDLQASNFNVKVGRYQSSMDYYSGYTQGFNLDYHFGYGDKDARPANEVKLWWFSSFGRAFAYSQWFLDYYAVKTTDGKISYGIHSLGADVVYGGMSDIDDSGYAYGDTLLVRPFFYFYPGLYEAPGMKATYEYQFGNGLGFKVTAQGSMLHVHKQFTTKDKASGRYNEEVDEWSGSLNLIAQGYIYNYNVRIGYYENFGSGNSHFGTYGNPMGIDFWTASVYDIGASISDTINRNARTGYLSGGGHYSLKYGVLSWDLLGRITRSPRSDEESIALSVNHSFKNGLSVGVKLEWFRDTTKKGYNPGAQLASATTDKSNALSADQTDDRSHAFFTLGYSF